MSKRGITEAEKLLDAIGQLPEDMLEQALETEENETETRAYRRQRRHRREIIGGLAAAAVLCRFGETRPGFCAAAAKC